MFRFTGSALALLVAFSLVPLAHSEAGKRHRAVKHQQYNMIDRRGDRFHRRHAHRVVARAVVVVKIDGGRRSFHRRYRQGDTYSGGVVITTRNGVGQWTYGSSNSGIVSVTVAPRVKIIDVGTLKVDSACTMQAGVCVIRP